MFFASKAPPLFPRCILRVTILPNQNIWRPGCEAFVNVSLSAERVLESLEQKGEGNDSMSSGEES